jgi:hypothetical protein
MAFDVVQRFNFEDVRYELRTGWRSAFRQTPPFLAGMTIVGFRTIFERINRYIEQALPDGSIDSPDSP